MLAAQVCQGLVLNKDDSIRPVRTFVREVFRCGKSDFDLLDFIVGFLIPPDPEKLASMTDKSKGISGQLSKKISI